MARRKKNYMQTMRIFIILVVIGFIASIFVFSSFSSKSFKCSLVDDSLIKCEWNGCSEEVTVALSNGQSFSVPNQPSGSYSFGPLLSGKYRAVLDCGDFQAFSSEIEIK